MQSYYINQAVCSDTLTRGLPELIPDAGMRRRMSKMVKMGVATGMSCFDSHFSADSVDAIITATGLGCLEDSEKFLRNLIENDEQLLNPTPFIQSTFNTVGAQIGLLCKNHSYNMTYAHRGRSFESALLDAILLLNDEDYKNILVGAIDYTIPQQLKIMERMGFWRTDKPGEGAFFFMVSSERTADTIAELKALEFPDAEIEKEELTKRYGVEKDSSAKLFYREYDTTGVYPTVSAASLYDALQEMKRNEVETIYLYNSFRNEYPSLITLGCI